MMRTLGFIALAAIASCATPRGGASDQTAQATVTAAATPHIDRISPDTVSVPRGSVVEVSIVGRGFAPEPSNTVEFDGMPITGVPSNATGTQIRFVIPNVVRLSVEAPPMPVNPGSHDVRVKNDRGASNTMTIVVLP